MKVAIADDDLELLVLLAEIFRAHGLRTRIEYEEGRATGVLLFSDFDSRRADLNLPDRTGLEVARRIKQFTPDKLVCIYAQSDELDAIPDGACLVEKPRGVDAFIGFLSALAG